MIKDTFKSITFITGVLIYFYVCGGLYLIAYWSSFNLDVSSFITLTDIPKNFVFPFIITNAFLFVYLYAHNLLTTQILEYDKKYKERKKLEEGMEELDKNRSLKAKKMSGWRKLLSLLGEFFTVDFFIIVYFWLVTKYYNQFQFSITFWGIVCSLFIVFGLIKINRWQWLVETIPNYQFRFYIKYFLIGFPVICFMTGKLLSLRIYNNDEIRPINAIISNKPHPIIDSTSLKLLGFIGNRAIVSSLDNKKIVVLGQDAYEGLELGEVKRKE